MDFLPQLTRRRALGAITTFLALVMLQLGLAAPAGGAPVASINGTVVSTNGDPLAELCVNAVDAEGGYLDGTRTDLDGTYRIELDSGVEIRVQFFDCSEDPVFTDQWYDGAPDFDDAEPIVLDEAQELLGVDATVSAGGSVSGIVRSSSAEPLGNICVIAVGGEGDSIRGVGEVTTEPDGSYTLSGLPVGDVRVLFEDCNDEGPYVEQWFDGSATLGAADVIDVTEGSERTGVDATLQRASVISGTVTGSDGEPLPEVCVQAVGADSFGGSTGTDDDGNYRLKLAAGGTYRVQFVDCDGDPTHAGRWFGGGADPSSAQPIEVAEAGETSDISAQLSPGAAVSLSGTATNIRGDAMTTACAVLYLADEFVDFRQIEDDGSYGFDAFGSGTYAVAFIGCTEEGDDPEAQMTIPDPGDTGIAYDARWRGGQRLELADDDAPDPIRQGAALLTVTPGEAVIVDECFGCGAISLRLTPGAGSVTATFSTVGVSTLGTPAVAASAASAASAAGLDYALVCSSQTAGVDAVSVAGTASPLVATGLDAGTGYSCSVRATSAGTLVAASPVLGVSTTASRSAPSASPSAAPGAAPATGSPPASATAVPKQLAFTG